MTDLVRQEVARGATTIVVKVGTRVLTRPNGSLNIEAIEILSTEIAKTIETGRKVVLVSSGAVAAGRDRLGLKTRPTDLARLQAASAVGQSHLIESYDRALQKHQRHAAQLLLTAEDLRDRTRYLNVRNTILALLEFGAVPIINENDTVSVDELQISFGDNDRLAAMVTNLIRAPLLVIFSDIEGLYDREPGQPGAKVIPTVSKLDESIFSLARDKLTGVSKGGMASKLNAARMVTAAGENLIIASGRDFANLSRILAGETVGTLFLPQGAIQQSRKRWISGAAQSRGTLILDEGAIRAVREQGRSLLAIGITDVEGQFAKGDVVAIRSVDGREIARGLSNYSAADLRRIRGLKTTQIAETLGHCPYDEVVHRDNLAMA